MERIPIGTSTRLLILTGAGVSAESGIPTFRDAGGLWNGHHIQEVASPQGFEQDPTKVWKFYSERRRGVRSAMPNAAHAAIARIEAELGDRFLLVTQNVDGLHRVAGSERMIEIHGNLNRTRCSRCARPSYADHHSYEGAMPICELCQARGQHALLRPDIVWFGESIDAIALARIAEFFNQCRQRDGSADLVFLAAGTSGEVYPAAGLVNEVSQMRGISYLANLEASSNARAFDHVVLGPATSVLPALLTGERPGQRDGR
jgi:NAD-dependent deacetylase